MFKIGDLVRVLYPFGESLAGTYRVVSIDQSGAVFIDCIEGAFDPTYLELA